MFKSRIMKILLLLSLNGYCILFNVASYIYSGSIFPIPEKSASYFQKFLLYLEFLPFILVPMFTFVYLISKYFKK